MRGLAGLVRITVILFLLSGVPLLAQGTRADYERAEQFLSWNVRKLVSEAAITPHWIAGGDTFWYLKEVADGREFWRVDPQHQKRVPAFDHARLASALSKATAKEVTATKLPFRTFEFTPLLRLSVCSQLRVVRLSHMLKKVVACVDSLIGFLFEWASISGT